MKYSSKNIERCPVCQSKITEVLYSDIKDRIGSEIKFSVMKCQTCSHAFTSPLPDEKYYNDYYSDSYYSYNIDIQKNNNKLKFKIKRWLYQASQTNLIYKLISRPIVRQTAIYPTIKRNGKMLDVGCGNGAFLSFMKSIGWKTYGVEISSKAVEFARNNGHEVFSGNVTDANYPSDFFDSITLNNVLEHIAEPSELMKEVYRILKPSGELIICVPNFSAYSSILFKQFWAGLLIPEHLQHFNQKSLEKIVNSVGFENIAVKGIFRKILKNNLQSYLRVDHNGKDLRFIYGKTLVLMLVSFLLFPLSFTKLGQNLCMFISLTARKN